MGLVAYGEAQKPVPATQSWLCKLMHLFRNTDSPIDVDDRTLRECNFRDLKNWSCFPHLP